jgi:8-oxo-dGTP diphosphatase
MISRRSRSATVMDLIEPVARVRRGPNRPAQLYRLKKAKSPVYFARTFNPPG